MTVGYLKKVGLKAKFAWAAGALLAALALADGAWAGNLLANGDFETSPATYGLPAGWNDTTYVVEPGGKTNVFLAKGSDYIPCCGVTGSAAAMNNYFTTFGAGDVANAGAVLGQDFATTAGKTYRVTLDLGALGYPSTQTMRVTLSDFAHGTVDASHDYVVASDDHLDSTFGPQSFTFVASSARTLIAISDVSPYTNSIDGVVDNVSVTSAAPEPQAWLLALTGLAALGGALRVRRRAGLGPISA